MTGPHLAAPVPATRVARPPVPNEQKLSLLPLDLHVQAVEAHLTPSIRAQIQAQFGPYLGTPTHSILIGNQLQEFLCSACLNDRSLVEAKRLFGQHYLLRYGKSILGRVLLTMLSHLSAEAVIRRSPRDMSSITNYGTRWVAELGPRHWRYDFEDEAMFPDTLQGLIEAGGQQVKLKQMQISYQYLAAQHLSFDIQW